jgi:polysaccharide biosynthesis/export protein
MFMPDRGLFKAGVSLVMLGCTIFLAGTVFAGQQQVSPADKRETTRAARLESPSLPSKTSEKPTVLSQPGSSPAVVPTVSLKNYRIGFEDELMISVWQEPALSTPVVVRPDGKITLPLVNDIDVVGLRTDELQSLLTERLKPFVNTPQVTVVVRGIRSRKAYLIGQVNRQGAFDLNNEKTILELLAEAGGLGAFAKTNGIYILRDVNGKKVRLGFDYKKAIAGRGPNPVVLPGDLVVVP